MHATHKNGCGIAVNHMSYICVEFAVIMIASIDDSNPLLGAKNTHQAAPRLPHPDRKPLESRELARELTLLSREVPSMPDTPT